jgi:hypothetical protein
MEERGEAAVDEESVHEAVLVVVNPGDARAHGFRVHALGRRGALVVKVDARFLCDVPESNVVRIRVTGKAVLRRLILAGLLGRLRRTGIPNPSNEVGDGSRLEEKPASHQFAVGNEEERCGHQKRALEGRVPWDHSGRNSSRKSGKRREQVTQ